MVLEIQEYKKRRTAINTPSFWESDEKVFYVSTTKEIKTIHKKYFIVNDSITIESFEMYYNDETHIMEETTKEVWLYYVDLMIKDTEEKFIDNLRQKQ